ncbi:hypothetical protein SAMN05216411_1344, partial [Nitrosospira multiformis]
WKELRYEGEACGLNRIARLMRQQRLYGIPQRKRWRKKVCGFDRRMCTITCSGTLQQVSPTAGG